MKDQEVDMSLIKCVCTGCVDMLFQYDPLQPLECTDYCDEICVLK